MIKIINSFSFKLIITLTLLLYFFITLDFNFLYRELQIIKKSYFFFAILIFLPNTFLFIYKWFLVINKFTKEKFLRLYKKLSKAIIFAEALQSSLIVDAVKFYYLKNMQASSKVSLLVNDKIITAVTKLLYTFSFLILILILYYPNKISEIQSLRGFEILLFLLILILIIFFIISFKKVKLYYKKYLSKKIIPRKKIFIIELFRNLLMSGIYFLAFIQFFDLKTTILFVAFSPIIETALRFQLFSSIGFREFIFLSTGNQIGLDQSIIIPSIFITCVTFLTSYNNFFISLFLKDKNKTYQKSKNLLIYKRNNDFQGTEDFYEQLGYISKNIPNSYFSNLLNYNVKKIIIVENFVNPFEFIKIIFFLKFFKGDSYLLHTEFITKTKNIYSYNDFNKENKFGIIISLTKYLLIKVKRVLKIKDSEHDKRTVFLAYFQYRLFTTKIISRFFNHIILAHPNMKYKNLGFKKSQIKVFPYFYKPLSLSRIKNKNFVLDFSGYLTSYRYNILSNLKYNHKNYKYKNLEKIINKNDRQYFIKSKKSHKDLIFSLHIEKENNWPYSSPARYYNSIKKNEIPIIFRKFTDQYSKVALGKKILRFKSKNKIIDEIKKLNLRIKFINSSYRKNVKNLINL